jgi:hypothetical protein
VLNNVYKKENIQKIPLLKKELQLRRSEPVATPPVSITAK